MIDITFPDNSTKSFPKNTTLFDIAKSISPSLAKKALAAKVDDEQWDLSREIDKDAKLEIITPESKDGLEIIRHDAAHIMAQAVKELYPDVQVTIGPAIENGFYYDFARKKPFTPEDLVVIEKRMQQITKRGDKFVREVWQRDDAVKFFEEQGEAYKAEIISSIPADQDVTLYRQGDFIDLCRGPHAPSTAKVKYYKLMKLAGAYWRGDSNNEMLQRIYGTAWDSQENLDQYLYQLEEAEKRDHRKLGRQMELFHIQEEAVGSVFWHHKGWTFYRLVEEYIREKLDRNGYKEVRTPLLIDRVLWEKSGHWEKFRENMFIAESESRHLALKPMNCPAHVQIFNHQVVSYRDLPLRMAEFGCCHRNEPSGSLHGLMRVRGFTQDDAHIFCTEEQITSETEEFSKLLLAVYKDFGFEKVSIKFSDRPEVRSGSDEVWDRAEGALKKAIDHVGLDYELNPGEGAFYGPKIEFVLTDALGRDWQCGTLQVDFVLPERLGAFYTAKNGEKKHPVMLHRAILGSFERFIGILIEQYAGKFPLWLAPVQIVVVGITNAVDDYVKEVHQQMLDNGFRAEVDIGSDKIGYKIRKYMNAKIPTMLILGEEEKKQKTVSVRSLGSEKQEAHSLEGFVKLFKEQSAKP
jgi:threonyl-tRNA synthetase